MKMRTCAFTGAILSLSSLVSCQWYPAMKDGEVPTDLEGFQTGDKMYLECIQRQIDTGEHKFDDQGRIVYAPFPKCKETETGLSLKYGVNEDLNCTIGFTDELYHLFQLYIHEDAPFSCRLPISSEADYIQKGGAYVPITFNFRGEVHDSHIDVDNSLNVIAVGSELDHGDGGSIVSATAWASGTNLTRIVIGDYLTLNLGVRWLQDLSPSSSTSEGLPFTDGFYKLPKSFMSLQAHWFYFYLVISAAIGAIIMYLVGMSTKKKQYQKWVDPEVGFSKKD